jgi:hypothetical protein
MLSGLGTVVIGAAVVLLSGAPTGAWAPRLAVIALFVSLLTTPLISRLTRRWSKIPEGAKYL